MTERDTESERERERERECERERLRSLAQRLASIFGRGKQMRIGQNMRQ